MSAPGGIYQQFADVGYAISAARDRPTTTSNLFWNSNRLPTPIPENIVAAARRTSPGLSPCLAAAARSTWTSIWGFWTWPLTLHVDEAVHLRERLLHPLASR